MNFLDNSVRVFVFSVIVIIFSSGCASTTGKLVKYEMTYNSAKIYNTSKVKKVSHISINMPFFSYLDAFSQERTSEGLYALNFDLSYDGKIKDYWVNRFKNACIKLHEYSPGISIPISYNGSNPNIGSDIKEISGCIKNPILYKYHKALSQQDVIQDNFNKLYSSLPKNYKKLETELFKNESYSNGSCNVLAAKPLPKKPETLCDNPEELAQARLSCLAPLGSKVCRSLTDGKAEKFIAGNACSLALKGKLDSSDLIFDALDSVADELHDGSGDFSSMAGSLVSGAVSFSRLMSTYTCVEGLLPGCESKIKKWEIEVNKIKCVFR